jgi:enoyl-CoA hydratase/carnithine racemase
VRSIRRTLRADLVARFGAMVDHERTEQLRLMGTADFREGIAASLARREPDFTGG